MRDSDVVRYRNDPSSVTAFAVPPSPKGEGNVPPSSPNAVPSPKRSPWPTPTDEQKAKIEQTAQAILDARAIYPNSSLADLYDEIAMPSELRKAHQNNDRAVMQAYGFDVKTMTESTCVAELMKMYQDLTK